MAAFREDDIAYPRMVELAACLCTELTASGLPDVCFCGVLPGAMVALDTCGGCGATGKCGQAWVRLVSVFPSNNFPNPDSAPTCASLLAFELEIGVMRCAPAMDSRGNPPTVAQQLDAVRLQTADMLAMRRAVACCMGGTDNAYFLGTYSPYGPQGGCVGGSWTVVVGQEF